MLPYILVRKDKAPSPPPQNPLPPPLPPSPLKRSPAYPISSFFAVPDED